MKFVKILVLCGFYRFLQFFHTASAQQQHVYDVELLRKARFLHVQ